MRSRSLRSNQIEKSLRESLRNESLKDEKDNKIGTDKYIKQKQESAIVASLGQVKEDDEVVVEEVKIDGAGRLKSNASIIERNRN